MTAVRVPALEVVADHDPDAQDGVDDARRIRNSQSLARQKRLFQRTLAMNAAVWSLRVVQDVQDQEVAERQDEQGQPGQPHQVPDGPLRAPRAGRTLPERE